jgi:hypothetical protein
MFNLSDQEAIYMVSQNAIPYIQHLGGYLPFVFTEQGVAMLSAAREKFSRIPLPV